MQFSLVFGLIFAINVGLSVYSNRQSKAESPDPTEHAQWKSLVKKYLSVYLLATLSDWLQGPYVYALYSAYEYTQPEIAVLFVAGFGSSMLFGSFVGGMADWGGRRRFVILYAVFYALSCLTKREYLNHLWRDREMYCTDVSYFSHCLCFQISRVSTFSC